MRTADGGRSFVAIPAPAVRYELAGCPYVAVSALAFADARNGYAYGCRLYVTHDGGMRWREIDLGSYVTDLAAGDGEAYAVVSAPNGASRLVRSSTARDDWVTLPAGGSPVNVAVRGSTVLVDTDTSQLLISHDQGNTFSRDNSLGFGLRCAIQLVTRSVVWAFCSGGMMGHVLRSTNGGHSFRLVEGGTADAGASGEYHAAVFAAASPSTAVVGFGQLLRTTDGGRSYREAGPRGQQWAFLAFSDPTHGIALAGAPSGTLPADDLYVTANAGRSFTLIPIRSAARPTDGAASSLFPGAPSTQANGYGVATDACPVAPPNCYLPATSGCVTVRRADVNGDGRPDLIIVYSRLSRQRPSGYAGGTPPSLRHDFVAKAAFLKVVLANGTSVSTRIRGTRAAAIDAVAHVNDDEIFLEVERISSGATGVAYGFHNGRLVRAGVMLEYGGDSATKTDFDCLSENPPQLIQRAYELIGPTIYGWWQETNIVYAWHGPRLVQISKTTFRRRGAVTMRNIGIGRGCTTGVR